MSTEDELHIALSETKLKRLIEVADSLSTIDSQIRQHIEERAVCLDPTLRNRALVGLFIKAMDSFECLLLDARTKHSESFHHLKTVAECFIYLGWISSDKGEVRAKLLFADGYRARAAYHEAIGEREIAIEWANLQNQEIGQLTAEWKRFRETSIEKKAREGNRLDCYIHAYRLACEAAHVGDLFVYIPPQPEDPGLRFADQALLKTYVCLKFGVSLACDLLHDASDALNLKLDGSIGLCRNSLQEITAVTSPIEK